ncbi:MAG: hypothetical protein QOF01_5137 [Thermomicrobiales bacterium]|jgi:probable HAF family extracellular repeat protein|nr:hypothetical protein [Thermomicrobiales bacterium]MEA2598668.1 hypothetical protein [Thermomicrobiales bacterium]
MVGIAPDCSPKERRSKHRLAAIRRLTALLVVGLLSLSGFAHVGARQDDPAARYAATDLGEIKGYPSTVAFALNAKGVVVGQGYDPSTYLGRATIYRGGKLRALIKGEKGVSAAQDINAAGQIVGYVQASNDLTRATLWVSDEATNLGDLGGGSLAVAINDAGVVVGWSSSTADNHLHPIVWIDGEMTALELLPKGERGMALNINGDGLVVGFSTLGPDEQGASAPQHAVAWEDGKPIDLGVIAGDYSEALGINAAGQIVGRSTTGADQTEFGPGSHAVLWDGDEITDLGALADGEISVAAAINARGEIVGRSSVAPGESFGQNHATLWRDGEVLDLNDLVEGGSDVVLDNAYDINDDGIIVAMGKAGGIEHAFLLTPVDS